MNKLLYTSTTSITHRHILAVLNSVIRQSQFENGTVRILDAGCGNCLLMECLQKYLPALSEKEIEIFGYDVIDHGVQYEGYFSASMARLVKNIENIDWKTRLKSINSADSWPFQNEFFDIVISNQVLEHVWDHNQFLSENHRVLKTNGCAIHLFPVKDCITDWHLFLPFVHWIKNWDFLHRYIKFCSRLGLGIFKGREEPLDKFSIRHADYIWYFTNYIKAREFSRLARKHRMRFSFKYTQKFYYRKLQELLGMKPGFYYNSPGSALSCFFKRISSVTIFLEKKEIYTFENTKLEVR